VLLAWLALAHAAPLDEALVQELDRALAALASRPEPPHYVALAVEDRREAVLSAQLGTVANDAARRTRSLDVDLRVGSPALDSTHELRGFSALEGDDRISVALPVDDDPAVLAHAVWRELDARYRAAAERIVLVRANQQVKVAEEREAPDFQAGVPARVAEVVPPALEVDLDAWRPVLVELSAILDASAAVQSSEVRLAVDEVDRTFVDSEGSRLRTGWNHARLSLTASTTAEDGDVVSVFESVDVHTADGLPDRAELLAVAQGMVVRLAALRDAPRGEPYSGPVLLAGRASGVFFHEVLGHRVEGHRQKREDEGHTFADHVGRAILPPWVDVVDDPTVAHLAGHDLNGHYAYDDEGMPAAPAVLVQDGVFTGFLMGRSPIPGFEQSNGHGRRSVGNAPVSRMGNTLVQVDGGLPAAALKERLRALAREAGLEYGVMVEAIDGGFTLTGRQMPNAFNVRASASWRVYADGRPDELVRGIDLVGTPFVAFSHLVAAGDTPEVFNGFCGAESGWVPVSAVAPPLLFERLEFQLKEKGQERPPLLPKPTLAVAGGDA
jgi:predicted Zn-dependent protease